jgi:hypothetical protein
LFCDCFVWGGGAAKSDGRARGEVEYAKKDMVDAQRVVSLLSKVVDNQGL